MRIPMKTSLYILSFNSPRQVRALLESFERVDRNFLDKPRKILIDNSTDLSTTPDYLKICSEYNIEHIKKDNIGIASGRQYVAEHFDESDSDYYIFFEDDMYLMDKKEKDTLCRMGYERYVDDLYNKTLEIMEKDGLDYLKLTYSEFFGDNSRQWGWCNIPQDIREKYFPENDRLPEEHDPEKIPLTLYTARRKYKDLGYLIGQPHFCNWPIWFSREGNRTVFIETRWRYPYEQTIMSWAHQLQRQEKLMCGVLELSPIEHDRFDHYPGEERREVS